MNELTAEFQPQKIVPEPTGSLSRPVLVPNSGGDLVLFHDSHTLYAHLTAGTRVWFITARAGISGFVVDQDTLYVQDGAVLCEYDVSALQGGAVLLPDTAISFRDPPVGWSFELDDDQADLNGRFAALFQPGDTAQLCSAPVICDGRIHVLRNDGKLFSPRFALGSPSVEITATDFAPDELALYLAPATDGGQQLCWLSGGKVFYAKTSLSETPGGGIDAWRWDRIRATTDQPAKAFGVAGDKRGFMGTVPSDSGAAAVVTLFDPATTRWSLHVVAPAGFPALGQSGVIKVRDAATGTLVDHPNGALPAGLTTAIPPGGACERAGLWPSTTVEILTAPRLHNEGDTRSAYVIARIGDTPKLCKFGIPVASADKDDSNYVTCWWKAVKNSYDIIQPILAGEMITYLVDDAAQAWIDAKTPPADLFSKSYTSPLWAAIGLLPCAAFDLPQPSCMTLARYPARLTRMDPATFTNPNEDRWARIPYNDQYHKPNTPLVGPVPVSFDSSTYLVVSNRNGIYGFDTDGALAWRLSARFTFTGWTTVGPFLFVAEGPFLGRYDMRRGSSGSRIDYPDMALDLGQAGYFETGGSPVTWTSNRRWAVVRPGDTNGNTWFDTSIINWAVSNPQDSPGDFVPHYDPNKHTIFIRLRRNDAYLRPIMAWDQHTDERLRNFPQAATEVLSIPLDASHAFVPATISSVSTRPNPYGPIPVRDIDFTTDVPTQPWLASNFPNLASSYADTSWDYTSEDIFVWPEHLDDADFSFLNLGVKGTDAWNDWVRRLTTAVRVNRADGVALAMSFRVVVRNQTNPPSLYCCFTKAQQNYFLKYTLPA